MANKGRQSFEKRQREADRQDRAREKAARRQERKEDGPEDDVDAPDEEALMAAYGKLAERHAAGEVDDETFAASKAEIFEKLGLNAE